MTVSYNVNDVNDTTLVFFGDDNWEENVPMRIAIGSLIVTECECTAATLYCVDMDPWTSVHQCIEPRHHACVIIN